MHYSKKSTIFNIEDIYKENVKLTFNHISLNQCWNNAQHLKIHSAKPEIKPIVLILSTWNSDLYIDFILSKEDQTALIYNSYKQHLMLNKWFKYANSFKMDKYGKDMRTSSRQSHALWCFHSCIRRTCHPCSWERTRVSTGNSSMSVWYELDTNIKGLTQEILTTLLLNYDNAFLCIYHSIWFQHLQAYM